VYGGKWKVLKMAVKAGTLPVDSIRRRRRRRRSSGCS
jgi:hypothetical protein